MREKDERHLPQVYVSKRSRSGKLKGTRALHAVTQLKHRWNNNKMRGTARMAGALRCMGASSTGEMGKRRRGVPPI